MEAANRIEELIKTIDGNYGSKKAAFLRDSASKDDSINVNSGFLGGQKKVIENFDPLQSPKKASIMTYLSSQMKNQKNIGSKLEEILLDSDSKDDSIGVNSGTITEKELVELSTRWLDTFGKGTITEKNFVEMFTELFDNRGKDTITQKDLAEMITKLLDNRGKGTITEKDLVEISTREPEELPENYSCLSFFSLFIPKSSNPSQESKKLLAHDDQANGTVIDCNSRVELWKLILPCIVNGGLFESISTLIIVTCASTVNIPNGNILALALTNMITGLFIIRHNLAQVLRKHKKKMEPSGIRVEQRNQLKKVLKDILLYLLPFTVTILSFLFFGMVPPLVYVFTFRDTDDKHFKLATMVGASLLCTTLLAFLKTHLQKPKNWVFYGKTVLCFVFIGVLAFVLSYLAGDLFGKLILKFDYWFE